jgi:hypothetical protein
VKLPFCTFALLLCATALCQTAAPVSSQSLPLETTGHGLIGQNSPPTVVFHGNCPNNLPSFQEWFQQTELPQGGTYVAQGERKERIVRRYAKLKLQMSLEEVEQVLGRPDFATPRPTARLTTTPEPNEPQCSNEVAYIFKKSSENIADFEDVAIYLSFSKDGKLYWVAPQNLPSLKSLGSPTEANAVVFQNQTSSWKEYSYPSEGFAITTPTDPSPHDDATMPEMKAHTVHLSPQVALTLRVSSQARDCGATLKQLKDGALNGKQPGLLPTSLRDVSVGGYPGVEWEFDLPPWGKQYERYICADGRFYFFAASWLGTQKKPAEVTRVVDSFRLLSAAKQPK